MILMHRFPGAKGIPFSDMLAPKVHDGRKTQTRREVKHPLLQDLSFIGDCGNGWRGDEESEAQVVCPYGQPGDILYIRETHYAYGRWEETDELTKRGKRKWKFVRDDSFPVLFDPVLFDKPARFRKSRNTNNPGAADWYKRLGRFMPKAYARTFVEIVSVRVERLQDISEADAIAEGVEPNCAMRDHTNCQHDGTYIKYGGKPDDFPAFNAKESFQSLWHAINGIFSWGGNPLVWVIEFRRILQ